MFRTGGEDSGASTRIVALDGLRGMLASMVVLSHIAALQYFPLRDEVPHAALWEKVCWVLGAPGVNAFLVLSGYVLYHATQRLGRVDTLAFALRRLVRLYPLYLAALGLALLLKTHAGTLHSSSLVAIWSMPLERGDLLSHLLPLNLRWNFWTLNPVLWSLVVELQVALLLPWLFARVRNGQPWQTVLFTGLLMVVLGFWGSRVSITLGLLPLFLMGAGVARHQDLLQAQLKRLPVGLIPLISLVAVGLWFAHEWSGILPRHLSGLGAAVLILLVVCGWGKAWWCNRALQFLGRVSYPLYLLHAPILFFLCSHFYQAWGGVLAVAVVGVGITLLLSHLLDQQLDRRAVWWSRRIALESQGPTEGSS